MKYAICDSCSKPNIGYLYRQVDSDQLVEYQWLCEADRTGKWLVVGIPWEDIFKHNKEWWSKEITETEALARLM